MVFVPINSALLVFEKYITKKKTSGLQLQKKFFLYKIDNEQKKSIVMCIIVIQNVNIISYIILNVYILIIFRLGFCTYAFFLYMKKSVESLTF